MVAIMRQSSANSRTARRAAAEGGALRASLTSHCSGATLCHEINDGICFTSVSYVLNPDSALRQRLCGARVGASKKGHGPDKVSPVAPSGEPVPAPLGRDP